MSGPHSDPPVGLEPRMLAHYRERYLMHMNDVMTGKCRICRKRTCDDFTFAKASLIAAGEQLPS